MLLEGAEIPERVSVVDVSDTGNTLGVKPIAGRDFSLDERRQGRASGVTIVSHAIWEARFGGRADAIGATVRLDGRPFTVIGVMPAHTPSPTKRSSGCRSCSTGPTRTATSPCSPDAALAPGSPRCGTRSMALPRKCGASRPMFRRTSASS